MADYDLAIIGGGLNGVSIARDAAGRGLRVILLEQGDLGAGASSASPRLIHGDLAVLERRAFLRVRAAFAARFVLCARFWPTVTSGCGSPRISCARCALRFPPIPTSVRRGCCGRGCCSTIGLPPAAGFRRRRLAMSRPILSATR